MKKKLGLYIHFPFCREKCGYCSFYSVSKGEDFDDIKNSYLKRLTEEIRQKSAEAENYTVDTIYIGGGTPSLMKNDDLSQIIGTIKSHYKLSSAVETTIECNPRDLDPDEIIGASAVGVNRLSIGIQTLSRNLYELIGRKGGLFDADELDPYIMIKDLSVCVDYIAGIPGQSADTVTEELKKITTKNINHLSVYMLSPDTYTVKKLFKDHQNIDELQINIFSSVICFLESEGFEHYEISNFARKKQYSRHNIKYWKFKPYLGFGPSSHSFFSGKRFHNPADIIRYINNKDYSPVMDIRGKNEMMAEFFMTSLRLRLGTSLAKFENIFNEKIPRTVMDRIQKQIELKNISTEKGKIFVNKNSFFVTDSIIYDIVEPLL